VVETGPASGDSIACASSLLAERGYDVRASDGDALEAESRTDRLGQGAAREIITASLDRESTPANLTITTRAWEYQPVQSSLTSDRQSVTEVRPSEEALTDAHAVFARCAG
jgi:hypothetical protein